MHLISKHLNRLKTYAKAIFLDFSSAFNTVEPDLLLSKMIQLQFNPNLIYSYNVYLTNRRQQVKVNDFPLPSGLFWSTSSHWFRVSCCTAVLLGSSVKPKTKLKFRFVQRLLPNLWPRSFQATHNKSLLRLAYSISSDSSHVFKMENNNFCPPVGGKVLS